VAELVVTQEVAAPQQQVWDVLTDWDVHDRWMLLTRASGGRHEGATLEAFTGVGRIGFVDPMIVTVWEPPLRAVVRHTGRVVHGSGSFEVERLAPARSRVVWSEWVVPPLGVVGRLGWPLVRPVLRQFVQVSLRRLARYVEQGALA
jgi:carbon monoxide dehydrogenase subunit G